MNAVDTRSSESQKPSDVWRWVLMALIVFASLGIRFLAWQYWGTGTIESEGAEYAKIAENIRNGIGYVGLVSPGPQVIFNPLFPFLIAGASVFTNDYELAGRLVALVLGALIPLPVFGIASRLFNRPVGYIAAILTLLHPLLLHLSFTVYSEGPYATLLLFATFITVRALSHSSIKRWILVGAVFAISYLLRAEAFAAFCVAVLFAFIAKAENLKTKCQRAACALLVFLAVASPEVLFLYHSTGKILLEAKSTILFLYNKRMLIAEKKPELPYVTDSGQHEVPSSLPNVEGGYPEQWEGKWAYFGIDSSAEPTGMAMRAFVDIARETRININEFFPTVAKGVRHALPAFLHVLTSTWLGAPLLPALALLGVFSQPWQRPQALTRLFVIVVMACPVFATFFVRWGDARNYFILVPFLCIWAANGLYEVGLWMHVSCSAAEWKSLARPIVSRWMFPGLLGLIVIITPAKEATTLYAFSDSGPLYRIDKEVGIWIKNQQNDPTRVMDISLPLSYHAGAQLHVYFPYSTGDLALRYLDVAKVDYVVLRRGKKFTHYYNDWLTHGIRDSRAERLTLPSGADDFVVYRWHRDRLANFKSQ